MLGLIERREENVTVADGTRLFEQMWLPSEAPGGAIVIVHGYGEHSSRYAPLAEFLGREGFSVHTYDQRGHGRSAGRRGHVERFDQYLDDLETMVNRARERVKAEKVTLLGHSMGGLVTLKYLIDRGQAVDRFAVSSPLLGLSIKVNPVKEAAGKLMSGLWPGLTMKNDIDANAISHDRDVVVRYECDPLVHHVATARWFTELLGAMAYVHAHVARVTQPGLWMIAGTDMLVDPVAALRAYDAYAHPQKRKVYFQSFYHEIFNELERHKPYEALNDWLKGREQASTKATDPSAPAAPAA